MYQMESEKLDNKILILILVIIFVWSSLAYVRNYDHELPQCLNKGVLENRGQSREPLCCSEEKEKKTGL